MPAPPSCETPPELTSLGQPLPRLAEALRSTGDVSIVAIGSSSTFGEGASPGNGYVDRLAAALAGRFPGRKINMHNAGVNGDEAPNEAARFKKEVISFDPSLVIWQVGTNAAWKDYFLDDVGAAIIRGIDHLSGTNADLVLMDLQYAPALLQKDETPTATTQDMLRIIETIATKRDVALFRRFDIMRYWHINRGIPIDQMISNFDGNWLHQNDWSYNCLAQALCDGLTEAAAPD
ncbi:SGNH/GDSL hydrolase family protein [Bradyrhizobium sp. USDA 4473]